MVVEGRDITGIHPLLTLSEGNTPIDWAGSGIETIEAPQTENPQSTDFSFLKPLELTQ